MPIRITCGRCHTSYPVDDDLHGRRVRCRECDEAVLVDGPFAATSEEAADRQAGILLPSGGQPPTAAAEFGSKLPGEREGPGADPPAGRPPRKLLRATLLVGIVVLGLIGLLAGAWAWDLFDLRSRWAPPSPPTVLSWNMPDRIEDPVFGGELPEKEWKARKTLLVVEVQLARRLLDGGSGWQEWSAEFRGDHLRLVTSDGQTSSPILITSMDPVDGPPPPAWPPGFGSREMWIPGSGSVRTRGQRPAPEHFKAKAAFVVPRSSVEDGGFRVQYKGVLSAPVPQSGTPAGQGGT
jgi:predicted Zn finger-like uncharacterized protein